MSKTFLLEREKTEMTPYVLIDEEKKYMKIEGESYHENVVSFYKEISEWLKVFLKTDFDFFTFDCELRYSSSSTVKVILNILLDMDNSCNSSKITVNWITGNENKIMIECGDSFKEELKNITFNQVIK